MSIALFPSAFHPSLGGVEELTRQLAHGLMGGGERVTVYANRWPKTLPEREAFEGIPLRRYCFRVPENNARQMAGALLYGPMARRQLCRDLRADGAHLLHVQCVSSNAYYALHAQRRLGLPLVVSLQGELTMDAGRIFQTSHFAKNLMREALARADAITACSQHTLREAEEFFGQPLGARGRVVYNGIRLDEFRDVAPHILGRPYILAIGRHVPQKGFDVLLCAYAAAARSDRPLAQDLIIAGDGPQRGELEKLAAELGLAGRAHFPGRTDRRQTAAYFSGCDFFVLPSRHEPQGIVNLEAMAAGKPVLATRVGGVPEIVGDGEHGMLVPADDVTALAAGVLRMAHDSGLRQSLGAAAKAHAAQFDWSNITAEYKALYSAIRTNQPRASQLNALTT